MSEQTENKARPSKVDLFMLSYRHNRIADWMYQAFENEFYDKYQRNRTKPSKEACYNFIMKFLSESLRVDKHYVPILNDFINSAMSEKWADLPNTDADKEIESL